MPQEIPEERERFKGMLDLHQQLSEETQQKMLWYVQELESRIRALPREIEIGFDSKRIASHWERVFASTFSNRALRPQ